MLLCNLLFVSSDLLIGHVNECFLWSSPLSPKLNMNILTLPIYSHDKHNVASCTSLPWLYYDACILDHNVLTCFILITGASIVICSFVKVHKEFKFFPQSKRWRFSHTHTHSNIYITIGNIVVLRCSWSSGCEQVGSKTISEVNKNGFIKKAILSFNFTSLCWFGPQKLIINQSLIICYLVKLCYNMASEFCFTTRLS